MKFILCLASETCRLYFKGRPLSEIEWEDGISLPDAVDDVTPPYSILLKTDSRYIKQLVKISTETSYNNYVSGTLLRNENSQDLTFIITLTENFELYEKYEVNILL